MIKPNSSAAKTQLCTIINFKYMPCQPKFILIQCTAIYHCSWRSSWGGFQVLYLIYRMIIFHPVKIYRMKLELYMPYTNIENQVSSNLVLLYLRSQNCWNIQKPHNTVHWNDKIYLAFSFCFSKFSVSCLINFSRHTINFSGSLYIKGRSFKLAPILLTGMQSQITPRQCLSRIFNLDLTRFHSHSQQT